MVVDFNPVSVTQTSDNALVLSKGFLDIQLTTKCELTLKHGCGMIEHGQVHHTTKYLLVLQC